MTAELWSLFAAVVLGFAYVGADSFTFKAQVGNKYTVGARDQPVERVGIAGRAHRAARNYTENLLFFVAVVFLLHASGESSEISTYGSYVWVGGRAAYLVAYLVGIPWTRTVCWQVSMWGLIAMMVELFI